MFPFKESDQINFLPREGLKMKQGQSLVMNMFVVYAFVLIDSVMGSTTLSGTLMKTSMVLR
jgi:hypothetical protein